MKCPVCHQNFTRSMVVRRRVSKPIGKLLGEHFSDGKGVIRCPHCEARLRKKISIWFIVALLPFVASTVLYSMDKSLYYLMYISIAIFMVIYISLPYVPYDK